jgi:hypothetical protein
MKVILSAVSGRKSLTPLGSGASMHEGLVTVRHESR